MSEGQDKPAAAGQLEKGKAEKITLKKDDGRAIYLYRMKEDPKP